jgi:hypothetical protein
MSHAFKAWWHEIRVRERQDARRDPETPARIVMCHQRKEDQLQRARDAGILDDLQLVAVVVAQEE